MPWEVLGFLLDIKLHFMRKARFLHPFNDFSCIIQRWKFSFTYDIWDLSSRKILTESHLPHLVDQQRIYRGLRCSTSYKHHRNDYGENAQTMKATFLKHYVKLLTSLATIQQRWRDTPCAKLASSSVFDVIHQYWKLSRLTHISLKPIL